MLLEEYRWYYKYSCNFQIDLKIFLSRLNIFFPFPLISHQTNRDLYFNWRLIYWKVPVAMNVFDTHEYFKVKTSSWIFHWFRKIWGI